MVGYEVALTEALFGEIAKKLHRPRVVKKVDDPDFEAESRNVSALDQILNIAYGQTNEQVADYDRAENGEDDERRLTDDGGTFDLAAELVIVVKLADCHCNRLGGTGEDFGHQDLETKGESDENGGVENKEEGNLLDDLVQHPHVETQVVHLPQHEEPQGCGE